MADDVFLGPRLKIKRARSFIAELEEAFVAHCKGGIGTVAWDHSGSQPAIKITTKAFDPMTGVIIGDIIHNLRAALDLMASELAMMTSGRNQSVHFPFATAEDLLEKQIIDKRFALCGQDAIDMLRGLKPYRGGNDKLRQLHDLDIQDKHRMLIPINQQTTVELSADYALDGSDFGSLKASGSYRPIFPDGSVLAGCHVVTSLKELAAMVEGIVSGFARLVLARDFSRT